MFKLNTVFSRIMGIGTIQRQSLVSLTWQVALTFIGFLSTMYFAHTVGASVMGGYFLILAYLGIIYMATDGGFGGAAVKRISEGGEPDAYFSAFVVLRSFFVIVVVIALIVFRSYFVDLNDAGTFIWLLLALIISQLYGAILGGMQGRGKIGIQTTAGFINNIICIIVQVVSIFMGFGVAGLVGGYIVGMFVGSIIQLRFLDLHFVRFGWAHVKSLSIYSLWIFLISGGEIVFLTADTVMIGYYLNNTEVGVYRIMLQFTILAAFTTNALRSPLYPKVSRWGKIGETDLIEESLSRALTYSLVLAIPVFAGGVLLGDKLLYYFYGAEFGRGYMTMVVLFLVQIVNVFQFFFTTYLSALGHIKNMFKFTAVAVAVNIVLNAALIPVIGIVGAAIATLITMIFYTILARRILSGIITIRLESGSLMNILKASIIMSLFVGGYRILVPMSNIWWALVPVVLGAVLYGVLVLKFDRKIYYELKDIMMQMNVKWLK